MKIVKALYLLTALSISVFTAAQTGVKPPLTLETSILKAYPDLYPEEVEGLQWLPESDRYTFVKERDEQPILYVGSPRRNVDQVVVSLGDLNERLGLTNEKVLDEFPALIWSGDDNFYFLDGKDFYSYDLRAMSGGIISSLPAGAENADFHAGSHRVAYTTDNNLYVLGKDNETYPVTTHENDNIVSGQPIARFEFGITQGTFWSPSGRLLAFYEKDESDVKEYPNVDYSTMPASVQQIKYPMAGGGSEQARIGIYDTRTLKTYYLETKGEKYKYLTNVSWGPDEQFIYAVVLNRDQDHLKLNQYDAATGKWVRTILEERDPEYVQPEHGPGFYKEDPNTFIWFSKRDGYNHLYHYNVDGTLLGEFGPLKADITAMLGFDKNGHTLYYQATSENGRGRQLFRADLRSGEDLLISTGKGTHAGKLSPTGKYILDRWSNTIHPNTIQVIDDKGNVQKQLLDAPNPLSPYAVGKAKLFTIPIADDSMNARIIYPADFDSTRKYPAMVYVYNGPGIQLIRNEWAAAAPLWMYAFANEGFLVFTVDGRGSANRGIEYEQSIFRKLGENEIEDQLTGVRYLKSLPYTDTNHLAVHGWSYGGFMTTSLMLRKPGLFNVGVAGGAVTDWRYYEVMYTERYMDTPDNNPEGYERADLKNYINDLEGKLLMIHGTNDDVVVMQHVISFLQHAIEEGIEIDFFLYPGHAHNVYGPDRYHLMKKVLGYIKDNI